MASRRGTVQWATLDLETQLESRGFSRIAGVDEVGRGPLAGPVVAAAVILPDHFELEGVADSKLLTDQQRRTLLPDILAQAEAVGTGLIHNDEIDVINILQATFAAMRQALADVAADAILVDGRQTIPGIDTEQVARPKADRHSLSVAAASIVAKVLRDDLMMAAHRQFPVYGFDQHKGYATAEHFAALDRHGPCAIHRQTFLAKWRERQAQTALEL